VLELVRKRFSPVSGHDLQSNPHSHRDAALIPRFLQTPQGGQSRNTTPRTRDAQILLYVPYNQPLTKAIPEGFEGGLARCLL
jgi:hypothetical protein